MILRKPYAILIKYFKTIHIVMFVLFGYLVFALRKIYVFFASYIETSNFTYVENMTSIYVPWILFFIVIILLGLSIGILFLMNKKEKPVLFYKIMIGFCTLLLGVLIYYTVFFKSLDSTVYEPLKIVANRDIILFVYIFNFFFVAFTFIRGFGFDIKKFSFDKDRRELNLEESDSEEYELSVTIEKDDIKSFINKHKRELSYYVKENKTILLTILIIVVVSLSLYFYYDIFVINKVYKQGDSIDVGNFTYRVDSSMISGIDKYGQLIGEENDYLVIKVNISSYYGGQLDQQALRIHIDDDYYYPNSSLCDLYTDVGKCYKNQQIVVDSDNAYIFAYKIKKEHKTIYLEILRNKSDEYQYSKVKLSCSDLQATDSFYNMNEEFELNGIKRIITSYSLVNKDYYEYSECNSDTCGDKYTKIVSPKVGEMVLSFQINNLEEISEDFMKSAIGIKYNDKIYTGKDITYLTRYSNRLYYSVPSSLKSANSFYLLITTRATRYNIKLEGNK